MRRRHKFELNAAVAAVLVLGIVVVLMMLAASHHKRWDLTANKRYSLSPQTIKILQELATPLKAAAFFQKGGSAEKRAEDLLEQYAYHSRKFTYEIVDPDRSPHLARTYDITNYGATFGTVVVECEGKREKVNNLDEESLTNALIKVTRKGKKVAYFLKGHGERGINDSGQRGFSNLKESIEKEAYVAKELNLVECRKVPEDASLVIVASPIKEISTDELKMLEEYLQKGGRMIWFAGADDPPAMDSFLAKYGFHVGRDQVVDRGSRLFGGDILIPAVYVYGKHIIVDKFNLITYFPLVRSTESGTPPKGATLTPFAFTSPASLAVTDLKARMSAGKVSFDKSRDRRGPVPVAVAGTFPPPKEEEKKPREEKKQEKKEEKKTESRIVVYGTPEIAANAYINQQGNKDLILNTVGWMTEEEKLISIRPKENIPSPLIISASQNNVKTAVIFALPLLVAAVGFTVCTRR